jgi:RimJ/RimL family protein N-acetyltransferase
VFTAVEAALPEIAPWREELRAEAACQIVHDSLYERRGWCLQYLLKAGGVPVGFAGVAIGGPWHGRRTVFDFYLRYDTRGAWPALWSGLVEVSRADSYELQTNLPLPPDLVARLPGPHQVDRIVYREGHPTSLSAPGARLRPLTSEQETQLCLKERAGHCGWALELDGTEVGKGTLLFHYNVPYADIAMDIHVPFRRRGLGSYLVQELKRRARELGAIPAARTSPDNLASQRTLEKAGMVRTGQIIFGQLAERLGPV